MERFWRINRTLVQKLQDTHYYINDTEKKAAADLHAFEATFPNRDSMERIFTPLPNTVAATRTPNGVLVCFAELVEDKKYIRVDDVRRLIMKMQDTGVTAAFFILNAALSSKGLDMLRSAQAPDTLRVVVFETRELMFNVTKHSRVPRHELLSSSQAHEWLVSSKLKRSQLPRVFESDPQCKYYDALSGDIIRVTRPSPTCGVFVHNVLVVRKLGK